MAAAATQPAANNVENPPLAGATAALAHNSSLYVGDVDKDVTEAQLYDLFQGVTSIPFPLANLNAKWRRLTFGLCIRFFGAYAREETRLADCFCPFSRTWPCVRIQ